MPIAELFNRLAEGATLEQIVEMFPAISQKAACDALREAASRFPPHASFHRAVDVWTPRYRYPYERRTVTSGLEPRGGRWLAGSLDQSRRYGR